MIARLGVLVTIALRNLRASPLNLLVGGLILFGTFFFVVLGALLDTLGNSMSKSVIGSVAGHVQVYSSKSKDDLAIYGGGGGNDPDLGAITDFPKIKTALESLPNVKTVVPMGISGALITSGNTVDITLAELRDLYKAKNGETHDEKLKGLGKEQLTEQIAASKDHVRQIIKVLQADLDKAKLMINQDKVDPEERAALAKVATDQFWADFDSDPYGSLEFLENKIAPQVSDANMLFLRYVGTDLDAFQSSFDRMKIVDGVPVPKGQRGFLMSKFFYEENVKQKNARRLDKIKDARASGRTIAKDPDLERWVKENQSQTRELVLQLDAIKTKTVVEKLQKELNDQEGDLSTLLTRFFTTTDENFDQRYAFFYEQLAPQFELYRVRVGDTLTIKTFTRSGYVKSVNMKVYGTFAFDGIEKSPLAGAINLMDLMSFRDLYGYLTADNLAELQDLKKAAGTKDIKREDAEAALFGDDTKEVVAQATPGVIDDDKQFSGVTKTLRQEDLLRRVYTQQEIDQGVVLNAAVLLKDGSKVDEAIRDIDKLSKDQNLGLKAVSWQQAAGLLGQIILFLKMMLLGFVAFIFFVAMIVIFNAMMMATLQRTQTFGTLRAIGAQRPFVLLMVLVESVVLGVLFGTLGMVLGSTVVSLIHNKGIPAFNDYAYFFFSGPVLKPDLTIGNLTVALVLVLIATGVSALLPAIRATRVSPLRAMQTEE